MIRRGAPFSIAVFLVLWSPALIGQPAGNLDVIRSIAGDIAQGIRQEYLNSGSGSAAISVLPRETSWYVDQAVYGAFAGKVAPPDSASFAAEFGLRSAVISYTDIRREGLFGEKTAERSVTVTMSVKVTQRSTGTVLLADDRTVSRIDRIPLSEIGRIEQSQLPITHGTLENEGIFSSLAEPVILIGALGVAVFLLFHVRS